MLGGQPTTTCASAILGTSSSRRATSLALTQKICRLAMSLSRKISSRETYFSPPMATEFTKNASAVRNRYRTIDSPNTIIPDTVRQLNSRTRNRVRRRRATAGRCTSARCLRTRRATRRSVTLTDPMGLAWERGSMRCGSAWEKRGDLDSPTRRTCARLDESRRERRSLVFNDVCITLPVKPLHRTTR